MWNDNKRLYLKDRLPSQGSLFCPSKAITEQHVHLVDHDQFLGALGQDFHVGRVGEDGFP